MKSKKIFSDKRDEEIIKEKDKTILSVKKNIEVSGSHRKVRKNRKDSNIPKNSVSRKIKKYFGGFNDLQILEKKFPEYQIANISILSKEFFTEKIKEYEVIGTIEKMYSPAASELLIDSRKNKEGVMECLKIGPALYGKVTSDFVDKRMGMLNGLMFFQYEKEKMLVFCCKSATGYKPEYYIAFISRNINKSNKLLGEFLDYENKHNIYRKKLIRPQSTYSPEIEEVDVIDYEKIGWDQVILPEECKRIIQENIVDYINYSDILCRNGMQLSRGILFYGKPGTGKSFVCKCLISKLKEFTGIFVAGGGLNNATSIFHLARKFRPSLVIFEDIDLLERKEAYSELLNELDGVSEREKIYTIFTTNHIDILEETLSERPGRIDVILEFSLPNEILRKRLIQLYAYKADLNIKDYAYIMKETEGVTPAFIKEMMKRAILAAIKKGSFKKNKIVNLRDEHIREALKELKDIKNASARKIVGF